MRDYLQTTGFEPILEHGDAMDDSMNFEEMDRFHQQDANFRQGPNGFSGQVTSHI